MNSISKISVLGLAFVTTLLVTSCEHAFFDAYDLRNRAAADVGLNEGNPTVWNENTPLDLGRIYYMFGNRKNGFAMKSYSGLFVKSIADKDVSKFTADDSSWSQNLTDTEAIDLQLGYMGLSALIGQKHVKGITFSLHGDTRGEVMEFSRLDSILNDPDNGPNLRADILEDSQKVLVKGRDKRDAKFWIVLEIHTAKDLVVTLHGDDSFNAKLDTSDANKVAAWIKVPDLVFPTMSGSMGTVHDTSFKAPDSFGWVAMCVPLFAELDGPRKGHIYPDCKTVIWTANTLRH